MKFYEISGTKQTKRLKIKIKEDYPYRYQEEHVEIDFLNESEFTLSGKNIYIREYYDSGDDINTTLYSGSGVYEIICKNEDENSLELKLKFSKFRFEKDFYDENKSGNFEDIILILHLIKLSTKFDLYFESNDFYKYLGKEYIYKTIFNKHI